MNMRAARFHRTGPPDVLQIEEVPIPAPGPGDVLVRVEAAGVNYADVVRRRGDFYPVPTPLPHISGAEVIGRIEAVGEGVDPALRGKRVLAFAGIGNPERFFATLRASGVAVASCRSFPDHHHFSDAELVALADVARRDGLTLVTTTKDLARLRGVPRSIAIEAFPVKLAFDDERALHELVMRAVGAKRGATV